MQRVAALFHGQLRDVRQRGLLCLAHVLQQRAGRGDRERQIVGAEATQIERAELVREHARGAREFEVPGRAYALLAVSDLGDVARLVLGDQQLRRLEAFELGFQRGGAVGFEHREAAGGEIEPGETVRCAFLRRPREDRG